MFIFRIGEPIKPDHVRIVLISDTHNQLEKVVSRIPEGDILVHCGDFSNNGERVEIEKFDQTMGRRVYFSKYISYF